MARRRSENDAQIEEVYATLPRLECRRLCQSSCDGPIPASRRERARVAQAGEFLPLLQETCSNLIEGQCQVYEKRPLICRLWGVVENMPCPYGCVPEGGHLSRAQGAAVVMTMVDVAGEAI